MSIRGFRDFLTATSLSLRARRSVRFALIACTAALALPATAAAGGTHVGYGPVHGTLTGENHSPTVNRNWSISVVVTDRHGHGLSGTVDVEFYYPGLGVVGKQNPFVHRLSGGHMSDTMTFPARAAQPLTFYVQAVVHTKDGSITLDWAVKVKK